jgi:uncharacterized protein with ParB-like and HNH nuclease domain
MSLEKEIKEARKEIISDGYDMSLGEIINLYKDEELKINPEFQRLFRWDITKKTRFIESIILGIPVPPIFVFQDEKGTWELIDGLQRLSTVLEFCGLLKGKDGKKTKPSCLEGTTFLPSLANKTWQAWKEGDEPIDKTLQLQIKRARIRVEILLKESDEQAKYELFQRLNTGGSQLSEQEVRNCIAVMINPNLHEKFKSLSENKDFTNTIEQTDSAIEKQADIELILRFFSFRNVPYKKGLDVHEYLDSSLIKLAKNQKIDWEEEDKNFQKTFSLINEALGKDAFKRWDGTSFKGKFLMSVFEVISIGISKNINAFEKLPRPKQISLVKEKAKALWSNKTFENNSGAGIRGTTRLANLLPLAEDFFKP